MACLPLGNVFYLIFAYHILFSLRLLCDYYSTLTGTNSLQTSYLQKLSGKGS